MRVAGLKTLIDRYEHIIGRLREAPLNCRELAEEINCSPRTVLRYIAIMRRVGYDVQYDAKVRGFRVLGKRELPRPTIAQL